MLKFVLRMRDSSGLEKGVYCVVAEVSASRRGGEEGGGGDGRKAALKVFHRGRFAFGVF